jgi:hypothetical protein
MFRGAFDFCIMKFGLILLALFLQLTMVASSTHVGPHPIKRTVECRILDASTGEALTGVQITIEGTEVTTWSDEKGSFTLDLSGESSSMLTCSLVSFETISLEFNALQDGAILYLVEK